MRKRHFVRFLAVFCVLAAVLSAGNAPARAARGWRVAVCADVPPFHYLDEDGQPMGMHVELMDYLADAGGFELEYLPYQHVSEALDALEAGDVDLVLGALPSDAYRRNVRFTESLSSMPVCMMVKNENLTSVLDSNDGAGSYGVAFELGTVSYTQLVHLPINCRTICGTQKQVWNALTRGKCEAVLGVRDSLLYMLEQEGSRDNYTITNSYICNVEYRLAVRADRNALLLMLNSAINERHADQRYSQIMARWMIDFDKQDLQKRNQSLLRGLVIVVGVGGIAGAVFLLVNARLKTLVEEKTAELNQKMRQLELAGELRNRLVEHTPGGNMLVRRDGTILLANPVARAMAGAAPDEELPGNIRDWNLFSTIWAHMEGRDGQEREKPELVTVGGGIEKHTYRCQEHLTSTGEELVLLVEDVTWEERRKQEIFEERKNQTLNRMIAGVAHEIKNPLTSIRTFASLISEQSGDPEFQNAFHQYVPREVDRISAMIEMLINYARPPREGKAHILVAELVHSCEALVYLSTKENIRIEVDVPEQLRIFVNGDQVRQALSNLLMNSIEAVEARLRAAAGAGDAPPVTPGQPHIRVSGTLCDGWVAIEVFDRGFGMTEEDIVRCTDPFFTTKRTGTGMGLAMTSQYIRENSGRMEIESALGEYTKIRMMFEEDTEYEADRVDH